MPEQPVFYEVNLSDCDGSKATLHIWSDGRVDRYGATNSKVNRLAWLSRESERDPEMPEFAREIMRKIEARHKSRK